MAAENPAELSAAVDAFLIYASVERGLAPLTIAAYARDLRRNGFSPWLALLLLPASFLFVALVVSSWFAHRVRGKVDWKGRSYKTDTAK